MERDDKPLDEVDGILAGLRSADPVAHAQAARRAAALGEERAGALIEQAGQPAPPPPMSLQELARELENRDVVRRADAAQAAAHAGLGVEAEELILRAIPLTKDPFWQSALISAFSETAANGPADDYLHEQLTTDAPPLVTAACMLALMRRCPGAVTPRVAGLLATSRSQYVRSVSLRVLAEYGDDRAAEVVLEWLKKRLKYRPRVATVPCEVGLAVTYLARQGKAAGTAGEVAALFRRRAPFLLPDDLVWLRRYWPQGHPDQPVAEDIHYPDPAVLLAWTKRGQLELLARD